MNLLIKLLHFCTAFYIKQTNPTIFISDNEVTNLSQIIIMLKTLENLDPIIDQQLLHFFFKFSLTISNQYHKYKFSQTILQQLHINSKPPKIQK